VKTPESEKLRAAIRSGEISPGRAGSAEHKIYNLAVDLVYQLERAAEAVECQCAA